MTKIYLTKAFSKALQRTTIDSEALCNAVMEMQAGLVDADLGGNLFKKRIAMSGAGKRKSYRTIVATKLAGSYFFVFGFKKNQQSNISPLELKALRALADALLSLDEKQIELAVSDGALKEIRYEQIEKSD